MKLHTNHCRLFFAYFFLSFSYMYMVPKSGVLQTPKIENFIFSSESFGTFAHPTNMKSVALRVLFAFFRTFSRNLPVPAPQKPPVTIPLCQTHVPPPGGFDSRTWYFSKTCFYFFLMEKKYFDRYSSQCKFHMVMYSARTMRRSVQNR